MDALQGKKILLGITGGIAAYKSAELARALIKQGASVRVVMTESAQRFITPLTLEVLTGHPVGTSLWDTREEGEQKEINHTEAPRDIDWILIAPATANFLGRVSHGLADDLLSNILLASHCPVFLCPAMNTEMYNNPLVQANLNRLDSMERFTLMEPASGELACGVVGVGRMPEPSEIVEALAVAIDAPKTTVSEIQNDLEGKQIVITAGPTREHVDPVRFLSNPSTGKMGYALAAAATQRGATVTLIHGPVNLEIPAGVKAIGITSAQEMSEAVKGSLDGADALIMAAAVADWTPESPSNTKERKTEGPRSLSLERTPDILMETREGWNVLRVGFAAETHDVLASGREKLQRKSLDLIAVNQVGAPGLETGFGTPTNAGWILSASGAEVEVPLVDKTTFAHRLLDAMVHSWSGEEK